MGGSGTPLRHERLSRRASLFRSPGGRAIVGLLVLTRRQHRSPVMAQARRRNPASLCALHSCSGTGNLCGGRRPGRVMIATPDVSFALLDSGELVTLGAFSVGG